MTPIQTVASYRRQGSASSRPVVPSSLGTSRSSPRQAGMLSSSPRSTMSSRDREDLRRRSLVGSVEASQLDDSDLVGFLSMIDGRSKNMGQSFMGASMLKSRAGVEGEAALDRSVLLEQSRVGSVSWFQCSKRLVLTHDPQIALQRYSEVTPTLTNLSTALDQLPRRLPPTPSTTATSTRARSHRTSGSLSISSRHSPSPAQLDRSPSFPEERERPPSFAEDASVSRSASARSFEGRMPGEFPENEEELVFEMSGITEGWDG